MSSRSELLDRMMSALVSAEYTVPDWYRHGHCRLGALDPDAWFPTTPAGPDAERAKRICRRCPVTLDCLRHAVSDTDLDGIWGGTDAIERKAALRRLQRRA